MKTGLIISWILLLSACSTGFDPDLSAGFNAGLALFKDTEQPPKNELNLLADKIVAEMLANNQFVGKQNAIAVASIVNLADLNTTSRLGHQLSEGIVHYLHNNGFRVLDYKLTGAIQVTPQGDFIHSRDWEKLKGQQAIDYLVSGTLDQYEGGLYISVRMVGLQSKVVVASSQTFISNQVAQSFVSSPAVNAAFDNNLDQRASEAVDNAIKYSDIRNRKVYMSNGLLIRKDRDSTDNN